MTIPVQFSPFGAIGAAYPTTDPAFSPTGKDKVLVAIPQCVWVHTGASHYGFQMTDGDGSGPKIILNRDDVLGPDGLCRYTPSGNMLKYLTAGWFVWEGTSTNPLPGTYAGPMLFVLNRPGFPTTGGIGARGRVVDFSTSRGHAMWPPAQWITVPAWDLVAPGTNLDFATVQLIQGVTAPPPLLGFKLRRDATCPDPEPIGGSPYTDGICPGSNRVPGWGAAIQFAADGTFQFQYNTEFNGSPPAGDAPSIAISLTL